MRTPPRRSRRLAGMAGTDPGDEIAALTSTLDSIEAVLDPGEMHREAADLREQAADPGLWADQDRGQKVTRRLSYLEAELARLAALRQRLADTKVLFDLAESYNDKPTRGEAAQVPDRGVRHLLRRGGGDQVDHVRGDRALRLRNAARRARHAPDGPDLQVRQPGAQADLVRWRRRDAGG